MKNWMLEGKKSEIIVVLALVVFALIIGATLATVLRGSDTAEAPFGWIEFWLNRYQTFIVGAVAIFGVVVAREQLDAGRRQHAANIKLSLKDRIDALAEVEAFSINVQNSTYYTRVIASLLVNSDANTQWIAMTPERIAKLKENIGHETGNTLELIVTYLRLVGASDTDLTDKVRDEYYTQASGICRTMLAAQIERERANLAQYWS